MTRPDEFNEPYTCPRCGGGIPNNDVPGAYPGALSRWDNMTELCSSCGLDEALRQLEAVAASIDPIGTLHPLRGSHLWAKVPAGLEDH